ncbi:hypothetical protein LV161_008838, partial [Aspergillus fumigatus]
MCPTTSCQEFPLRVIYQSHSLIAKNSLFRERCALHRLLSAGNTVPLPVSPLPGYDRRCAPVSATSSVSLTATSNWSLLGLVLRRTISLALDSLALPAVPTPVGGPLPPTRGALPYPNFAQKGENA